VGGKHSTRLHNTAKLIRKVPSQHLSEARLIVDIYCLLELDRFGVFAIVFDPDVVSTARKKRLFRPGCGNFGAILTLRSTSWCPPGVKGECERKRRREEEVY
jgi:hypothetical protein